MLAALLLLTTTLALTAAGDAPAVGHPYAVRMHVPPVAYDLAADTVTIPVRIVNGHAFVDVMIHGRGPYAFFFDTGAQGSVMDIGFARAQGFALGERVMVGSPNGGGRPGQRVTVDTLGIGGLTLRGLTSIAFDGLPAPPGGAVTPRGVIGPYGLAGLLVTLDYAHERLVLRRGALPAPDGRDVFGWDPAKPLPEIPVVVAGHEMRVHLDSGSPEALGLPAAWADSLPLAGPLVEMGRARTVDRDVVARGAHLAGTFTIGRYALDRPVVRFADVFRDVGNVGYAILRQFTITIDPAQHRLRLDGPASGMLEPAGK